MSLILRIALVNFLPLSRLVAHVPRGGKLVPLDVPSMGLMTRIFRVVGQRRVPLTNFVAKMIPVWHLSAGIRRNRILRPLSVCACVNVIYLPGVDCESVPVRMFAQNFPRVNFRDVFY